MSPARSEALVTHDMNAALGTVARLTYIGDVLVYDIEASGLALKVESATDGHTQRFSVGDKVMCEWLPKDMQVFPEAA